MADDTNQPATMPQQRTDGTKSQNDPSNRSSQGNGADTLGSTDPKASQNAGSDAACNDKSNGKAEGDCCNGSDQSSTEEGMDSQSGQKSRSPDQHGRSQK